MPTKARAGLDAEIDALFRLPLADFTAARNALAARLRKGGRPGDAERVKSLAKPPAPAWAVNQLYWENPEAIDRLLGVAERIRKAQTGRLENVELRELLDEKKRRSSDLLNRAAAILGGAGHAASPDAMRRVSATLESLAVWGNTADGPKAGRLTAELDPPGFEALANVLAFRTAKPAEDPAAARARAREAVQAAEKALRDANREAGRAQTALTKANARTALVEKQKQEIEARYAEAKEEARQAANEAKKAAQAVAEAERSLARAKGAR